MTTADVSPAAIRQERKSIDLLQAQLSDYRILRQIGTGAGSKIYLGKSLKTGDDVAIKHIVRESADDDRFFAQAENEYHICSKLDHPALRKCHSIHRIRKRLQTRELGLVMEYVDGLNLEKARPNRLNTFLVVFHRVAAGLDVMHQSGFVHADIKPINIMLTKGANVKIIDFGQACPMHHRKERIQGTPDYIAPEQVRRLPLDRRTDVFNLGATMYWVLTSEKYPTAIRGADTHGGANVITPNKPIAPIELNDKIPRALSNFVMECCSDNPAARPADMKQVISRLEVIRKLWNKYRSSLRGENGDIRPPGSPTPEAAEENA